MLFIVDALVHKKDKEQDLRDGLERQQGTVHQLQKWRNIEIYNYIIKYIYMYMQVMPHHAPRCKWRV